MIPAILAATAGSVDVIGFLGFQGLFVAHITGNLIVLVAGDPVGIAPILGVPVFVAALFIAGALMRDLCGDGSVRWLQWNTRTVPERGVVFAVGRDVTDRRRGRRRVARGAADGGGEPR